MSKTVQGFFLALLLTLSSWALALPTPKDIEASVQAGQFERAESQLREVLKDKPNSAKAHYELGQVLAREGRYFEARDALQQAQRLEPSLKFASDPQRFHQLLANVTDHAVGPASVRLHSSESVTPAPSRAAVSAARVGQESSLPWGWWLLAGAGVVLAVVWMRRAASANALAASGAPAAPAMETRGYGFGSPGYGSAYPQGAGYPGPAPTPSGAGSTVAGAVVGGLAGMAAGYALSKALEGDGHAPVHASDRATASDQGAGYVPFSSPAPADDLGAFDAGAGDGWDNADAGSSDDW